MENQRGRPCKVFTPLTMKDACKSLVQAFESCPSIYSDVTPPAVLPKLVHVLSSVEI